MDEGNEPERIEIELTSHEPAGAAARARRLRSEAADGHTGIVATGDVDGGDDGDAGPLATERGRLLAVGVGAAVVALLIGVVVGRMGSGEVESSDAVSTTEEPTTTTSMPGDNDTLPRAPDIQPPPTTRPPATTTNPTTTTIHVEGWVERPIVVAPEVASEQDEVVALTTDGQVVRIDVATGTVAGNRVVADGRLSGFGGPALVYAGTDWVLVPTFDGEAHAVMVFDDGMRSSVDLGGWTPMMVDATGDTFWRPRIDRSNGEISAMVEVMVDGTETGVEVDLGGRYPMAADPLGGFVVAAPGGTYTVGAEATTRLTDGRLIATGSRLLVVEECTEQLVCGYFAVDRATGERAVIPLDPSLEDSAPIEAGGWWSVRSPLSPEEDALIVVRWGQGGGGGQTLGVVDLTTGEYTDIGGVFDTPQAAWSTDGGRVYWLDEGALMVFDRATGESVLLSPDLDAFAALAVRPSAGDDG